VPADGSPEPALDAVQDPVQVPDAEPVDDALSEPDPTPPAQPEKPRVVTRSRRRSASRPAGPPASADGVDGTGAGSEAAAEQPADETPSLHVPVKRKGTRKR